MDIEHIEELRDNHITNDDQWEEFEKLYKDFPATIHPKIKRTSIGMALLLWSIGIIVLFGIFYIMFIIFQLALYNIIMGVVMAIFWWRLCQVSASIIKRILDKGKKKEYKAYFRKMKDLEWLG